MTLKIPLKPPQDEEIADRLQEIDFEAKLRQALKSRSQTVNRPSNIRVVFADEE
ncbi:MAG TPA: hypothetical protein VEC99_16665 [Clostridia bacterium]|nr:hypothetical protein [Clostridia bacterium]